jgi:regulator of sirC expression with transglutaminase-like and TPR domain
VLRSVAAAGASRPVEQIKSLADAALATFAHAQQELHVVRACRAARCSMREHPAMIQLLRREPGEFVRAAARLLFQDHGFQHSGHGASAGADRHLLPAVLEHGVGSSLALAILLREICRSVGVAVAVRAVGGGRYCVSLPATPAVAAPRGALIATFNAATWQVDMPRPEDVEAEWPPCSDECVSRPRIAHFARVACLQHGI